jgi:hypothetical protein
MDLTKLLYRTLLGSALVASIGSAPGCASETSSDDGNTDEAEVSAPGGRYGPALFRNDFSTFLMKDGHYGTDDVRQLVYMPTTEALQPNVKVDPAHPLAAHDAAYAKMKPMDFYQQGLVTRLATKIGPTTADGSNALENELVRNPISILIVPGIFGEFIPVSPFEEVFRVGGVASVDWDRKLKALEADPNSADLVKDKQYSTAAVGVIDRPMRELMRVGSIDDAAGRPLVTITYIKPALGSLETFGTLDENADFYLPRLEKYFKIMGVPKHLYVMGYSRGTATALNLVTRAQDAHASWFPELKGVITLAGVVYGSQLADAAFAPGAQHALIENLQDFVENKLQSCPDGDTSASIVLRAENYGHWAMFLAREAMIVPHLGNENAALSREGIETANADVAKLYNFVRRIMFGDPKQWLAGNADGLINLSAPIAEHCQNVQRGKTAIRQLLKGVTTLTTDARVAWFKGHTLPTTLRYFSITGTMGDVTAQGDQPSPLVLDEVANDIRSLDFRSLRQNYYDLFNATGNQLQDSQVPVQRALIWNDVNHAINPAQPQLKTYNMGTVGIHHWGLSFPRAFSTNDGRDANPFPRTIFLKSIGTFIAQVESRGG